MSKSSPRRHRAFRIASRLGLATVMIASPVVATSVSVPTHWPAAVTASYKIAFNGIDIGRFEFRSNVSGSHYALAGDAHLSALLGVIKWEGATRSSGTVSGRAPKPARYQFRFSGTAKSGAVEMRFARNAVAQVASVPPADPEPELVPVRQDHLKGVLDPLSAVMELSRADLSAGNPCNRRLPVFDGKQRFDLVLSYSHTEAVREAVASGAPGHAVVCRVRYKPIAGYKPDAGARRMAAETGIQVALRPVPEAGLYVPYRIVVPTPAGSAYLQSERVVIQMSPSAQIALVH